MWSEEQHSLIPLASDSSVKVSVVPLGHRTLSLCTHLMRYIGKGRLYGIIHSSARVNTIQRHQLYFLVPPNTCGRDIARPTSQPCKPLPCNAHDGHGNGKQTCSLRSWGRTRRFDRICASMVCSYAFNIDERALCWIEPSQELEREPPFMNNTRVPSRISQSSWWPKSSSHTCCLVTAVLLPFTSQAQFDEPKKNLSKQNYDIIVRLWPESTHWGKWMGDGRISFSFFVVVVVGDEHSSIVGMIARLKLYSIVMRIRKVTPQ